MLSPRRVYYRTVETITGPPSFRLDAAPGAAIHTPRGLVPKSGDIQRHQALDVIPGVHLPAALPRHRPSRRWTWAILRAVASTCAPESTPTSSGIASLIELVQVEDHALADQRVQGLLDHPGARGFFTMSQTSSRW